MTPQDIRSQTYVRIVEDLDRESLPYVVQRGYSTWPDLQGDADILVDHESVERIVSAVSGSAKHAGWDVVVVCRHVDEPVVWAAGANRSDGIVEVDVASDLWWAAGRMLDTRRALSERRPYGQFWIPRPGDESVIVGLPALMGTELARGKGPSTIERVRDLARDDPEGTINAWTFALGPSIASRALAALDRLDIDKLRSLAGPARAFRLSRNLATRPGVAVRRLAFILWQRERAAGCGLWSAKRGQLQPIRKLDLSSDEWGRRLAEIIRTH